MKKKLMVAAGFAAFSWASPSGAECCEPLTATEKAATAVMLTTLYVDYRQTLDIKNHPGLYERNPLLGRHPGDARVRNYFIGAALASVAMVYVLPQDYRMPFIGGVVALELVVIGNNARLGLKGAF